VRILAVSGSLREDSFNTRLLREAAEAAPDGVELELWDGLGDLPPYDEDLEARGDVPPSVIRLRRDWTAAEAILFATPEYNGSVPGVLKNAIDWASRPRHGAALANQTVAVVGASTGRFGSLWAQTDLKRILGVAGARVVGAEIPVARARQRLDASGRLLDEELRQQLGLQLETLAAAAVPADALVAA
jgi:chromate reductase